MGNKSIKIALISTGGGHFEQLLNLSNFYSLYDHFWITNDNTQTRSALKEEKCYFIRGGHFKKPWQYLAHFQKFNRIFKIEKPSHIITTGSGGTALVPFILAKFLTIKFIYIETFSRVKNYTNLAHFIIKFKHPVYSQWHSDHSKNVFYIGPIFNNDSRNIVSDNQSNYIFVTLGTRGEQFERLLQSVEELIEDGTIREKVIVQAGFTKFSSTVMEIFDFCKVEEIDQYIKNAKYVITQESAGIGSKCLKYNKRFIVMPRDYAFKELPAKSDMNEDLQYRLEEFGYTKVVKNVKELRSAIEQIDQIKTGFNFDNSLAVKTLKDVIENQIQVPFVDLKAQYESIKDEIDKVIQEVINDATFVGGTFIKKFENGFGKFCGVKHCIGVSNGAIALFIAL